MLAGDLLRQLRVEKGYGHSRAAFVARFSIRWGEYTQRFLEVGRTSMVEDVHLAHLAEIGLVKEGSRLYEQFQVAIAHDERQKCGIRRLTTSDLPFVLPPVPVLTNGETQEEKLVREVFEAFQIDVLFDAMSVESRCPVTGADSPEGSIHNHPNQPTADSSPTPCHMVRNTPRRHL